MKARLALIYSKTCEYAIRALQFMAEKEKGTFFLTRTVSRGTGVPFAYLAKIFQDLARHNILDSRRGASGGFALKVAPEFVSLRRIMEVIDDPRNLKMCVMGFERCSDENACHLHETWKASREKILSEMERCSIAELNRKTGKAGYRGLRRGRLHTEIKQVAQSMKASR